jgi:hypothetical protein
MQIDFGFRSQTGLLRPGETTEGLTGCREAGNARGGACLSIRKRKIRRSDQRGGRAHGSADKRYLPRLLSRKGGKRTTLRTEDNPEKWPQLPP